MPKIYVFTQAYNAEATIGRAIESILAQTHRDLRHYVLDSNSEDSTYEMITHYARRDHRVVALQNGFNRLTAYMDKIPYLIAQAEEDESDVAGFIMLDADDTYRPDALEQLLAFMNKHKLDMAAGGFNKICAETGEEHSDVSDEDENQIHYRDGYVWHFPAYYLKINRGCGKLISLKALMKCDFSKVRTLFHCADTAFIFEVIKHTDSFGILAQALYNYYEHPQTLSKQFNARRMTDGRDAFDMGYSFLSSFGEVNDWNRNYLLRTYFNMIWVSVYLMNTSQCCDSQKQKYLKQIFDDPLTEEAFMLPEITEQDKFDFVKAMFD